VGGEEIAPVETGHDEDESEKDGNDMPDDHPALEAANKIARQRDKKLFHGFLLFRSVDSTLAIL
jgi:hypothetical protein